MTCPECKSTSVNPYGWINDGVTGPKCETCGYEWVGVVMTKDNADATGGHTAGEWATGKRKDGSRWLSIGNPATGPHYQGDIHCSDADAVLIIAAPDLLAEGAAVAALLDEFRTIGEIDMSTLNRANKLLKAAIARATGATP